MGKTLLVIGATWLKFSERSSWPKLDLFADVCRLSWDVQPLHQSHRQKMKSIIIYFKSYGRKRLLIHSWAAAWLILLCACYFLCCKGCSNTFNPMTTLKCSMMHECLITTSSVRIRDECVVIHSSCKQPETCIIYWCFHFGLDTHFFAWGQRSGKPSEYKPDRSIRGHTHTPFTLTLMGNLESPISLTMCELDMRRTCKPHSESLTWEMDPSLNFHAMALCRLGFDI